MLDPRAIQIEVDGSCYGNPGGQSGCAAVVRYPEQLQWADKQIVDYGCGESTNQRMELMPCIRALQWVRENQPWPDVTRVQIISDSTYVVGNMVNAPYWKKNKWRNRYGQPIFNSDLWDDLLTARAKAGVRVDFEFQKGKKTEGGQIVHMAATRAARRGGLDKDRGYKPGAVRRSMVKERVAAVPYPARGQIDVIWPYVKKPVSKKEERISFNLFDEATQAFHSKFYAFATPLMAFDLHTWRVWRVRFNDEQRHPQIEAIVEEVPLLKGSN
ncbi:MAG: RNase H family protein [Candidatus Acidiferrales bacterium]